MPNFAHLVLTLQSNHFFQESAVWLLRHNKPRLNLLNLLSWLWHTLKGCGPAIAVWSPGEWDQLVVWRGDRRGGRVSNVREGWQAGGKGGRPPTTTNTCVRSKPKWISTSWHVHRICIVIIKKTTFSHTVAFFISGRRICGMHPCSLYNPLMHMHP